jgi:hypothetical protein
MLVAMGMMALPGALIELSRMEGQWATSAAKPISKQVYVKQHLLG